jgi:3-deoxy-manno-octulosonate cytidylyltransferase (CMP-KDO synthetase)
MTEPHHATGTDRIAEVATRVPADLYVNIQGDEPMVRPASISAAIVPFLESRALDYEVTNLMAPIRRAPDIIDSTVPKVVVNDDGYAVYLSRSPIPYPKDSHGYSYYRQVCVYGFTPAALAAFAKLKPGPSERAEGIELLRFIEHGIRVKFFEVDDDSVAVDTPSDLETVRRMWTEDR